jgi:hypothetical protein
MGAMKTQVDEMSPRILLDLLNGPDSDGSRGDCEAVERIMSGFHYLQQLREKYHISKWPLKRKSMAPSELNKAIRALNNELARYEMLPTVSLWGKLRTTLKEGLPDLERYGIEELMEFWRDGSLERVKRCLYCEHWFFAMRSDRRFCSSKCKGNHRDSRPGYRTKRNPYFADYQRWVRSGDPVSAWVNYQNAGEKIGYTTWRRSRGLSSRKREQS